MSYLLAPVVILTLGSLVLWVWMLVDCLSRKDEDFPGGGANDKLIWALIIILTNALGALIYLVMVKLNHSRRSSSGVEDPLERADEK